MYKLLNKIFFICIIIFISNCSTVNDNIIVNPTIAKWDKPIKNDAIDKINDVAGYRVYIGTKSGGPYDILLLQVTENEATLKDLNLVNGIYYMSITAYNKFKVESNFSNAQAFEWKK